jgi:hypothetical protein
MSLTPTEIQSLRFHLGFGQVGVGAFPYTNDGFQEVFEQVIAPNLQSGASTTSATAVVAAGIATIVLADATGFVAGAPAFVDVGEDCEEVVVRSVAGLNLSARFALVHPGGYQVALVSGESRLRYLMLQADKVWRTMQSGKVTKTAGLHSLDKGSIVWFQGAQVLKDILSQYQAIAMSISSLVRVKPAWYDEQMGSGVCTAY